MSLGRPIGILLLALTAGAFDDGRALAQETGAAPGRGAPSPPITVTGTVVDSTTRAPIARVVIEVPGRGISRLTDAHGRFELTRLPAGPIALELRHVAYEPVALVTGAVVPGETLNLQILMVPYAYRIDEYRVEADRVLPTTFSSTTRYRVPRILLESVPFDDAVEALTLLPGVVVSGGRLFFRGVGVEHVLPLIDDVPARDPIKGAWVMPPPDALVTADFVAGAFTSEYGQALGGVMEMRLDEGRDRVRASVAYKSDHLQVDADEGFNTDHVELSLSGPARRPGLYYAASWNGRLTDDHLAYDRGRPQQDLLDAFTLFDRMEGSQSGALKLTLRPPGRSWHASMAAVYAGTRYKPYHHHYARSGDVLFNFEFGERIYEDFVTGCPEEDPDCNLVFYEGPRHVPVYSRSSAMVMGRYVRSLGERGVLKLNARAARHDFSAGIRGERFEELERTSYDLRQPRQEYFALHGDYPDYEDGRSDEAGVVGTLRWRPGWGQEIRTGGGVTFGRHRFFTVDRLSNTALLPVGSVDEWMKTFDGFAYIEDHWQSDKLSSIFLSFRLDEQRIWDYPGSARGTTVSPRLGFRHPMTDRDAIHVQAGLLYAFPTLQRHFIYHRLRGVTLTAQRTRNYELGFQHHFSSTVVGYLAGYQRSYSDVVFAEREAGELDFLVAFFGGNIRQAPEPYELDTYGLELTFDVQPHPRVRVNASVTTSTVERDGKLLPWDRNLFVHGWLLADLGAGFRATTTWNLSRGAPYTDCRDIKGCGEDEIEEGRLPGHYLVNMSLHARPGRGRGPLSFFVEVRNVLGRQVPEFFFNTYPSRVSSLDFQTAYLVTGETGGYAVGRSAEQGGGYDIVDVDNPQTRSAGRNIRLGVDMSW